MLSELAALYRTSGSLTFHGGGRVQVQYRVENTALARRIFRLLTARIDWDEAENLVQEAFFTLWCNLDKYNENRNIIAYLLTIVKNACLKYIRDLKIHDNNQDKMIEAILFSNLPDEEPDENLHRRLNQILAQLPEKQKEVLLKHAVEHKTLPSIAKELDIAESTAKTHYKRAIAILRKNLQFIIFGF